MKEYHRVMLGMTCCYLLPITNGYLMVDCGGEDNVEQLLGQLKKLKISIASIHYLFLTHHHGDHSGLLVFLCSQNPQLRIVLSRLCAEYLSTGHNQEVIERYATPALSHAFWLFEKLGIPMRKTFPVFLLRPQDIVIDQEEYDLTPFLGKTMTALATPGHTFDSLTLLYNRYAFVGDSTRNLLNLLGAPYEPICQENPAACQESIRKLLSIQPVKIFPGHGRCFSPSHMINRLKSHHLNG